MKSVSSAIVASGPETFEQYIIYEGGGKNYIHHNKHEAQRDFMKSSVHLITWITHQETEQ